MRSFVMVLITLNASLVLAQKQERPASPLEAFGPVLSNLQSDLRVLHERDRGDPATAYSTSDVNFILSGIRTDSFARIPPDDEPLRQYLARRLPEPIEDLESSGFVPKERAESFFESIKDVLTKLMKVHSFVIDIKVASTPSQARFELVPTMGASISTTTNDTITNVYRGEYTYVISKAGYKEVTEHLNFIERSGTTLECQLLLTSDEQSALPCKLKD
jgi:hypothetical protein